MSGFWSAWVIVLMVLNLGITLFLFLVCSPAPSSPKSTE